MGFGLIPEQIIKNDGKWCFECCLNVWVGTHLDDSIFFKAELLPGKYVDIYMCEYINPCAYSCRGMWDQFIWECEINL